MKKLEERNTMYESIRRALVVTITENTDLVEISKLVDNTNNVSVTEIRMDHPIHYIVLEPADQENPTTYEDLCIEILKTGLPMIAFIEQEGKLSWTAALLGEATVVPEATELHDPWMYYISDHYPEMLPIADMGGFDIDELGVVPKAIMVTKPDGDQGVITNWNPFENYRKAAEEAIANKEGYVG